MNGALLQGATGGGGTPKTDRRQFRSSRPQVSTRNSSMRAIVGRRKSRSDGGVG